MSAAWQNFRSWLRWNTPVRFGTAARLANEEAAALAGWAAGPVTPEPRHPHLTLVKP
jgi:hypothetical protein